MNALQPFGQFGVLMPWSMVVPLGRLAIRRSVPDVIEALAVGPGGRQSALKQDFCRNTALHLVLNHDPVNETALRAILKAAPEAALDTSVRHMLPIEVREIDQMISRWKCPLASRPNHAVVASTDCRYEASSVIRFARIAPSRPSDYP
jgi:hypothetical protein